MSQNNEYLFKFEYMETPVIEGELNKELCINCCIFAIFMVYLSSQDTEKDGESLESLETH